MTRATYDELAAAVASRRWEDARDLLARGAEGDAELLTRACDVVEPHPAKVEVVRALCAQLDPDECAPGQPAPISLAAGNGDLEVVRAMLESGACTEPWEEGGFRGPLHRAVVAGRLEVVRLLLAHKADVDLLDWRDQTPLNAAMPNLPSEAMLLTLIEAGADLAHVPPPDYVDEPMPPLLALVTHELWGRPNLGDALPRVVAAMVAAGADPDLPGPDGRTARSHAASKGREDLFPAPPRDTEPA